jgi:imidazolonepropionase-like amidohydrolase
LLENLDWVSTGKARGIRRANSHIRHNELENYVHWTIWFLCLVGVEFTKPASAAVQPLDASATAFVQVNVIPVETDGILTDRTVIVRNGQIEQIGPAQEAQLPSGIRRIDARGQYLIPGLADMHVHLFDDSDFTLMLANGVTTIVNMAGGPYHLEWREKLRRGDMLGPLLFTAGPAMENQDEPFLNLMMRIDSPEKARALVGHCKKAGYDFVKVHGDPLREVYDAYVAAAREHDIRVVGHGSEKFKMEVCLDAKQATIEHAEEFLYCYFRRQLDDSRFADIVAKTKAAGSYVTPTLVTYAYIVQTLENIDGLLTRPELRYYDQWKQVEWGPSKNRYLKNIGVKQAPRMRENYEFLKKLTLALHRGGVPLMTGSDYGGPGFLLPGFDVPEEMKILFQVGLTPQEVLRTATWTPATFLGDEAGAVRKGARADLVLLDGNPLQDIGNVKKIAGVMVRGKWLPKSELSSKVEELLVENAEEQRILDLMAKQGVAAAAEEIGKVMKSGKKCPVSLIALVAYGRNRSLEGELNGLVPVFELLVKLYPDSYISHDLLGKTYLRVGKQSEGERELRESLRLNPNNIVAQRLLDPATGRGPN